MSQPKALFLADVIKADPASKKHHDEAAIELRRLHEVNAELLKALNNIEISTYDAMTAALARAAIAKARGKT